MGTLLYVRRSTPGFAPERGVALVGGNGDWLPLLKHNLADIQRTRELADLAGRFVARSDFNMKNLEPPRQ